MHTRPITRAHLPRTLPPARPFLSVSLSPPPRQEIEGAATDADYPEQERAEFAFARYLHFTRVYCDPQEEEEEEEEEEEVCWG